MNNFLKKYQKVPVKTVQNSVPDNPMVTVVVVTYQHAKYIEQCLDGILMQKTTFPFEILLGEDESKDGTREICIEYTRKYPEKIKLFLHSRENVIVVDGNETGRFNLRWNLVHAKGKYVAWCDGDDYWTDPMKLQKQVDFLENHPDYNLVCHNWEVQKGDEIFNSGINKFFTSSFSFTYDTLPYLWITQTLTLLYRNNTFDISVLKRYKYSKDVHMIYHLLLTGKGYFMPEIMGRYRLNNQGIWSKFRINKQKETSCKVYKELYYYEKRKSVKKRLLYANLAYFNVELYSPNNIKQFLKSPEILFRSIKLVSDFKDVILLVGAVFPSGIVRFVRNIAKI